MLILVVREKGPERETGDSEGTGPNRKPRPQDRESASLTQGKDQTRRGLAKEPPSDAAA